jgi:hypothetical protein
MSYSSDDKPKKHHPAFTIRQLKILFNITNDRLTTPTIHHNNSPDYRNELVEILITLGVTLRKNGESVYE